MKRKGIFCLALASVMGLSVVGMAACGNDDTTTPEGPAQQQTTYYQVTLQYESSQGTVTKSDSASSQGYASGETVTVTVTAKSGYVVKSVTVDGVAVTAGADGKYSITVSKNTTVVVAFEAEGLAYPTDPKYNTLDEETDSSETRKYKGSFKAHDPVAVEAHRTTSSGNVRTTYYAFSTDNDGGCGVQVRSSSDLAVWKFEGAAIDGFTKADGSPVTSDSEVRALFQDSSFHLAPVYNWIKNGSEWGTGCWTLWAPDVVPAANNPTADENGGWWMYSCWTTGFGSMRSVIFKLNAQNVAGPYTFDTVIVRDDQERGIGGGINEIDPSIFYSADGSQMFLSYGSYGAGFGIIELDPSTGHRKNASEADTVAGKSLVGGSGFDAEGSSIAYYERDVYSGDITGTNTEDASLWEKKGSYVMMGSDGNLSKNYVMRTWECDTPDGTYTSARGIGGFQVAGNWSWGKSATEANAAKELNYYIPGHNDMLTTSDGRHVIVYHTRVTETGEGYSSGEHYLYSSLIDFNSKGQLIINPNRYAGEKVGPVKAEDVLSKTEGKYSVVQMTSSDVGYEVKRPVSFAQDCVFHEDGTITGAVSGTWKMYGSHYIYLAIGSDEYYGTVMPAWIRQYDASNNKTHTKGNAGLTISAVTEVNGGENKIIYFNMQF